MRLLLIFLKGLIMFEDGNYIEFTATQFFDRLSNVPALKRAFAAEADQGNTMVWILHGFTVAKITGYNTGNKQYFISEDV